MSKLKPQKVVKVSRSTWYQAHVRVCAIQKVHHPHPQPSKVSPVHLSFYPYWQLFLTSLLLPDFATLAPIDCSRVSYPRSAIARWLGIKAIPSLPSFIAGTALALDSLNNELSTLESASLLRSSCFTARLRHCVMGFRFGEWKHSSPPSRSGA